ncbi:MAG: hypothetical protein RIR06_410 [Bacteroidota bacterium]
MKHTSLLLLIFLSSLTFGQTRIDLTNSKIYGYSKKKSSFLFTNPSPLLRYPYFVSYLPKIKYEFGSIRSINIGLSTIDWEGDDIVAIPAWYNGPFLESGIAFSQPNNLLCNKVGYEYFWLLLGGRLNIVHYTDFHNNQFLFRPEVGLSLFSFLTFTYGYNFKLPSNSNLINAGSIYSINLALPILKKEYRVSE